MPALTSKGQVTIPKAIRTRLGLKAGSQVEFVEEDGKVLLKRSPVPEERWKRWRGYLKQHFPTSQAVDEFTEQIRGERSKDAG